MHKAHAIHKVSLPACRTASDLSDLCRRYQSSKRTPHRWRFPLSIAIFNYSILRRTSNAFKSRRARLPTVLQLTRLCIYSLNYDYTLYTFLESLNSEKKEKYLLNWYFISNILFLNNYGILMMQFQEIRLNKCLQKFPARMTMFSEYFYMHSFKNIKIMLYFSKRK